MVKLVVLYKKPANPAEFDKRYFEQHLPIANKIPGLKKVEVAHITGAPMGESEYYLQAELYFENMEAMKAGLNSPEGKATAKDVMEFAKDIISMMFAEVDNVPAPAHA
jgi:uncharacterized protein (TIGR02118 family)